MFEKCLIMEKHDNIQNWENSLITHEDSASTKVNPGPVFIPLPTLPPVSILKNIPDIISFSYKCSDTNL